MERNVTNLSKTFSCWFLVPGFFFVGADHASAYLSVDKQIVSICTVILIIVVIPRTINLVIGNTKQTKK